MQAAQKKSHNLYKYENVTRFIVEFDKQLQMKEGRGKIFNGTNFKEM